MAVPGRRARTWRRKGGEEEEEERNYDAELDRTDMERERERARERETCFEGGTGRCNAAQCDKGGIWFGLSTMSLPPMGIESLPIAGSRLFVASVPLSLPKSDGFVGLVSCVCVSLFFFFFLF